MLECSFAKLHMPSPLPYHRRRQTEPSTDDVPSHDSHQDCNVATVEPVSEDSIPPIDISVATGTTVDTTLNMDVAKPKKQRKSKKVASSSRQAPLIDLARMQHWSLLVERAAKHKREARYRDADGLLPLHWAVSGGPPVEVVKSLLLANPKGASAVDYEGSTAAHFACHYGASAAVVDLLITSYPAAVAKQDNYGRSPLYHAVDKRANLEVVRYLIHADPSMITKPCLPQDEELVRQVKTRNPRPPQHTTPLFMAWAQATMDRQTRDRQTGRLWDKAQMLLEGAYAYHTSQRIYPMVHAAVTLDAYLPKEVLTFAIKLFPDQLYEKETSTGRVPLAIAAATHQLLMSRSQEMIRELLKAYPNAARISDDQHRTPLALAAANGKAWTAGVEDIFRAAPDLIQWRDGFSKAFPALVSAGSKPAEDSEFATKSPGIYSTFQLRQEEKTIDWQRQALQGNDSPHTCAWTETHSDLRHLSTVFELLRADPSIIK